MWISFSSNLIHSSMTQCLIKIFGSRNPFLNNSPDDSLYQFPPDFGFTDPEELRHLLNKQLSHFYGQKNEFHEFGNQQQSAEWDKLMEQHQKDIEEFRKKCDKNTKINKCLAN